MSKKADRIANRLREKVLANQHRKRNGNAHHQRAELRSRFAHAANVAFMQVVTHRPTEIFAPIIAEMDAVWPQLQVHENAPGEQWWTGIGNDRENDVDEAAADLFTVYGPVHPKVIQDEAALHYLRVRNPKVCHAVRVIRAQLNHLTDLKMLLVETDPRFREHHQRLQRGFQRAVASNSSLPRPTGAEFIELDAIHEFYSSEFK